MHILILALLVLFCILSRTTWRRHLLMVNPVAEEHPKFKTKPSIILKKLCPMIRGKHLETTPLISMTSYPHQSIPGLSRWSLSFHWTYMHIIYAKKYFIGREGTCKGDGSWFVNSQNLSRSRIQGIKCFETISPLVLITRYDSHQICLVSNENYNL